MNSYVKVLSIGIALIMALVVSLIAPIHAIADDTTPPPPIQTEEPLPVETAEPLPTEEVGVGIDAATDQENGLVVNQSVDLSTNEAGEITQPEISEIIEQLPEGTGIHLETEYGVEPLVTAQAESLILVGDPIWCPDGVDPIANTNGCSDSYTSLEDLISNFPDPGAPGVIWIMEGVDTSVSFISIDGANYANWDAEDLDIRGGWNGDALGTISSTTTFNVPLEIINWTGNITINDLVITGASGTGLTVDIAGDVVLGDLDVTGNDGSGLYINSGGVVTATNISANDNGLVSLSGAGAEIYGSEFNLSGTNEFSGNYESGLFVSTSGDIAIDNLTANDNGVFGNAFGAELYSASGDVDLLGTNQFIDNNNSGLYIQALAGVVTLENITANNNGLVSLSGYGAEVYGLELDLSGTNEFSGNYESGLLVSTSGNIALENLSANNNGLSGNAFGAELYSVSGDVDLLGTSEFMSNNSDGLLIQALAGTVTAENITANSNGLISLSGYGAGVLASEFNLSGTNEFNGNYESGLFVSTSGDITINNLIANNNGSLGYAVGAELYSALGDVELLGINQFVDNLNNGLYVEAPGGGITAENIAASSNGIGNSYAPGAELISGSLDLTGTNEFNGNNDTGLYAEISGDINISNIVASNNGMPGTYGPGAELYSTGMVTITGANIFSGNSSEGLVIDAAGNISILNFNALNNDSSGLVFITNADAYAECGSVLNNGSSQIDTSMTGVLTLTGVDFGGDPDQNVGIDESQLTLVSNMCFTYPDYYGEGENGFGGGAGKKGLGDPDDPPFIVKYVSVSEGQDVNLDCAFYQGTYLLLDDGDGAIIPCPIIGSAKLDNVEDVNPYNILPDKNKFISGMSLDISGGSQIFKPVDAPDIVWYFNGIREEAGGYEAVYWDGNDWVDVTDQIPPFLTIFFLVPEDLKNQNLAILYWDGKSWIELSNGTHLGQGRIVSGLGFNESGNYFQANLNFIGVFVLVQK